MATKKTETRSSNVTTLDEQKDGIRGKITMNEDVVATIAGLAARDIKGIHSLGKSSLINFGDSPTRGVEAEVGDKQAALDLDVAVNYGCDIKKVAQQLRREIADQVMQMAGRDVIEVNIHVVDIKLPEEEAPVVEESPRVI